MIVFFGSKKRTKYIKKFRKVLPSNVLEKKKLQMTNFRFFEGESCLLVLSFTLLHTL